MGNLVQTASRTWRRDSLRTTLIGMVLFAVAAWLPSPAFPNQTGTQSGPDPYSQGVVLLAQQKWKEAAAEFQQAIHSNPKNSQAYAGLGVALTRLGNTDEAETAFNEAIRLDPQNVQAHYYLGLMAAESQHLEDATKELKLPWSSNPILRKRAWRLALALEESGQIKDAIGEYQTVLKRNPKSAEAHNGLGQRLRSEQ